MQLEEARAQFIDIGNRLGAVQCLQSLGNILRMQHHHEEARLQLEEARSQFIDVGNRLGAAQCLQSLGENLQMQDQYDEALHSVECSILAHTIFCMLFICLAANTRSARLTAHFRGQSPSCSYTRYPYYSPIPRRQSILVRTVPSIPKDFLPPRP